MTMKCGETTRAAVVSRSKVGTFCEVKFELSRFFTNLLSAREFFPLKINVLSSFAK